MATEAPVVFWVLRYLPDVPLHARKHAATRGRYPTPEDAEQARRFGDGDLLEVLERRVDQ